MDDKHPEAAFACSFEATHVEEADELVAVVHDLCQGQVSAADMETKYNRYHQILEKYHEQAQLLDPHLGCLVAPLSGIIRQEAVRQLIGQSAAAQQAATGGSAGADIAAARHAGRFLWALITVRGYKTVVRFFSSEVADLEPTLDLLLLCDARARESGRSGEGLWQLQCTLLLWLYQLLYIPFNLSTVDSSLSESRTSLDNGSPPPLTSTLLALTQRHLSAPGGLRDMSSVLLGRLLTRPDSRAALDSFLGWAEPQLRSSTDRPEAVFLMPGITRTLAHILKQGHRLQLLPVAQKLWPLADALLSSKAAASSVLTRKLALKLAQRIALTLLPPRIAAWRYERQCLDIERTLQDTSTAGLAPENALQGGDQDPSSSGGPPAGAPVPHREIFTAGEHSSSGGDYDVPEAVEVILGCLLEGLADKDTVVRWSAAKGIGRVCARLPKEQSDEVVEVILDGFSDAEHDTAWHGGCLALAELARRGLLLPGRLPDLAQLMAFALQYDVRRGSHSVGAHVRDAAAYVCWAFARAYAKCDMEAAVEKLAPALLAVACYDREVNCRRAASAAFQESVGRLGNFPHGIEILCAADYYALASRTNAYVGVAPFIAGFPEYRPALVQHLLRQKLSHWDQALRELASRALAALVPKHPVLFATDVLDDLLPMCLDPCLELRHGAALAVAEVLLALDGVGQAIHQERLNMIAGLVPAIESARLYRGKGGELMRASACRLLECTALSSIPLEPSQSSKLLKIIEDNLRHPSLPIQAAAAAALHAFSRTYLSDGIKEHADLAVKYAEGLRSSEQASTRQGSAAALGALPFCLLRPHWQRVIIALGVAAQIEADIRTRDAESRVAAVKALANVAAELFPLATPYQAAASPDLFTGPTMPEKAQLPPQPSPGQGGEALTETASALGAKVQQPPKLMPIQSTEPAGQAATALHAQVLRPLLAAVDDYCTDDRGDVGSWVRDAAMAALARILPLWAGHDALGRGPVTPVPATGDASVIVNVTLNGPGDGKHEGGGLPGGVAPDLALAEESCGDGEGKEGCGNDIRVDVACALLKQAAERLDRLRKAAAEHLQGLLQCGMTFPDQEALQRAVADTASDTFGTTEAMKLLAPLLQVDSHREAVLEGMIACIGGLDGHLSKAASSALVQQMQNCPGSHMQSSVAASFLEIWRQNRKSPRLAVPLLKMADILYSEARFEDLPDSESFSGELLEMVRGEMQGCRDVPFLTWAATVLCHLVGLPQPICHRALRLLSALLANRYPKVRKAAAEQLYIRLLTLDEHPGLGAADLEAAQELLCDIVWDGQLAAAEAARAALHPLLGLEPPRLAGGK